MSRFTIVNNELVPEDQASLFITDLSIQRGYGIFDYFKTMDGSPVFLDDHLDRFYHSAAEMQLPVAETRDELKELLNRLMEKNNIPDSGIRITLTGGYSPDGYNVASPNLIVTQAPFNVNREAQLSGITLMTFSHQRQLSSIKTLDYLMAIRLQPLIRRKNADDVLYHNNDMITECPRANFFMISKDGKLQTPARNILKGVIRKQILEFAGEFITAEEKDITLTDVREAQEAFITSTTKNILPVVQINDQVIGTGRPGPKTLKLVEELNRRIITSTRPADTAAM
ncbi:MAG TPA: aminotransferase class IV [Sphingobacteriaceae bacterium]